MNQNKGLQGASYLEPRNRVRTSSSDSSDSSCGDSEGSQEKLRRLFQTCDSDGDGFIDGQDIYLMCRELNMEDSVHDLMVQLGADRHGRISFEEFLRCQRKLRGEIRSVTEGSRQPDLRRGSADGVYQDRLQRAGSPKMGSNSSLPRSGHLGSWPASSDNSLGASSTARDSWERDSGARDLSPEPGTFLQKLMDSATAAGGGANFLELANTVSTCLCLSKQNCDKRDE
ncbi:uncharacterized protein LOC121411353 [Lytechinus variegatus]|uniref:uncharacterized protein LOC121411353 n=1 Tax=Lytechinus variegatus TaxID=7654 RepID=UPI001BB1568D|nr:uncharacterized protein LOC121411353 [Lytechinus variegatus]